MKFVKCNVITAKKIQGVPNERTKSMTLMIKLKKFRTQKRNAKNQKQILGWCEEAKQKEIKEKIAKLDREIQAETEKIANSRVKEITIRLREKP